jgi:transposase InsO family protein
MRYGITFTEVNSRYRWFYPLRSKSDALSALQTFNAEIRSHGFEIKTLKSDNGGEFSSHAYKSFCLEAGIVQRFTQPHTPRLLSDITEY